MEKTFAHVGIVFQAGNTHVPTVILMVEWTAHQWAPTDPNVTFPSVADW
jgi:hypothetical protein